MRTTLLFLLFYTCLQAQPGQFVPDTLAKRLKVKTVTEKSTVDTFGFVTVETYNLNGKVIKRQGGGGGIDGFDIFYFEYNNLGQLIKETEGYEEIEENGDTVENIITYTYNADGRIAQKVRDHGDGYIYTDKYIYFTCKNYVCGLDINSTDKEGKIVDAESYKYNKRGDEIETDILSSNMRLPYKTAYTYNNKGKIIEEIKRYTDGVLFSTQTYSYNNKNQLINSTNKHFNKKKECEYEYIYVYEYDAGGLLIKNTMLYKTHATTADTDDPYPSSTEETSDTYTRLYEYTFY